MSEKVTISESRSAPLYERKPSYRILVVDDEDNDRELNSRVFIRAGYDVGNIQPCSSNRGPSGMNPSYPAEREKVLSAFRCPVRGRAMFLALEESAARAAALHHHGSLHSD
jgi:hypothetical protein